MHKINTSWASLGFSCCWREVGGTYFPYSGRWLWKVVHAPVGKAAFLKCWDGSSSDPRPNSYNWCITSPSLRLLQHLGEDILRFTVSTHSFKLKSTAFVCSSAIYCDLHNKMSPRLSPIYLSSIFLFLCTTIKAWGKHPTSPITWQKIHLWYYSPATTSFPNSTTTASLTPTYCGGCYVDFEKEAATRWWSDVFVDYVATIVYTVQGESTIDSQTITEADTSTLSADIYSAAYDYCLRGGNICQGTANATFVDAST